MRVRAVIAVLIFGLAFGYRFTTMGGVLGGFENDQFIHLSQARQILLGDWPIRDFIDPGIPAIEVTSAVAQAVGGPTLLAEAVLTIGMVALSSALLFLLAARASGSILVAAIIALLQIAMAPRLYNYSKLLVYAVGIAAIWAYLDGPAPRRLVLMALAGVGAFLFRHDHGAYIGTAAILAVVVARWPDARAVRRDIVALGAIAFVLVAPFLVYAQANGGVYAYFRTALSFAARDAGRTNLVRPRFVFDVSQPLMARVPPRVQPPTINVRWAGVTESARGERERTHGLVPYERLSADVWKYSLKDQSRGRLEAIVRDPHVSDTEGIDRSAFTLNGTEPLHHPTAVERLAAAAGRLRILPGILRESNAVPFLYYLLVSIPIITLVVVSTMGNRAIAAPGWNRQAAKIGVVAVLALLMTAGLLRGNLPSRLADVSEVVGVLGAWLTAFLLARHTGRGRAAAMVLAVVTLVLTALSINALEGFSTQVRLTGIERGVAGVELQSRNVYIQLTAVPPAAAWGPDATGIVLLARYVAECTLPSDRIFSLGYTPELFTLSARGFAGGAASLLPGFYGSEPEQRQVISRMTSTRVPIVVTVPEPEYSEDYKRFFPLIDAFLHQRYVEAGVVDLQNGARYRILVQRDLPATGTDDRFGLPCYR